MASSQTGYDYINNGFFGPAFDSNNYSDIISIRDSIIFDSAYDKSYPPAPAMRFQVAPGYATSCFIHIEGFHNKATASDTTTWEKSVVTPGVPLDIVFRNPTNPSMGYISKVYVWSEDGGTPILWTPLVRF